VGGYLLEIPSNILMINKPSPYTIECILTHEMSKKNLNIYFLNFKFKVSRNVTSTNCVGLIELADRLCLPRLVTLVEDAVIKQMVENFEKGEDNTEDALRIMQPCQVIFSLLELTFSLSSLPTVYPEIDTVTGLLILSTTRNFRI